VTAFPLWVHEIKHDGYRLMVRRDGCHRVLNEEKAAAQGW
jgi:ATP-dependent DNA ligase